MAPVCSFVGVGVAPPLTPVLSLPITRRRPRSAVVQAALLPPRTPRSAAAGAVPVPPRRPGSEPPASRFPDQQEAPPTAAGQPPSPPGRGGGTGGSAWRDRGRGDEGGDGHGRGAGGGGEGGARDDSDAVGLHAAVLVILRGFPVVYELLVHVLCSLGMTVMLIGAVRAMAQFLNAVATRGDLFCALMPVRRQFAKSTLLGLDFLLAADVAETLPRAGGFGGGVPLAGSGLGHVVVVMAIRAALTLMLELEVKWKTHEGPAAPSF